MAADLRDLLTDEEYNSARSTTPNAHCTSPEVINAIWHGLCRMGLTSGAQILEPAAGIGHFFGLMPESHGRRAEDRCRDRLRFSPHRPRVVPGFDCASHAV